MFVNIKLVSDGIELVDLMLLYSWLSGSSNCVYIVNEVISEYQDIGVWHIMYWYYVVKCSFK